MFIASPLMLKNGRQRRGWETALKNEKHRIVTFLPRGQKVQVVTRQPENTAHRLLSHKREF